MCANWKKINNKGEMKSKYLVQIINHIYCHAKSIIILLKGL